MKYKGNFLKYEVHFFRIIHLRDLIFLGPYIVGLLTYPHLALGLTQTIPWEPPSYTFCLAFMNCDSIAL